MTSNNNTISVRLSADAQELQRALSQGTGYIESFAGRATGAMRDVARETGKLEGGMSGITSAAKVAAGAFAALGIGLSVGALTGWVRGAIDAADSVSKLAQKTGLAVKEVGGLQLAFRQAGVEDGLQTSLARLAKEASKGNDAFAAMSVTVKNSDGGLKSTRELMGEVADKFASYKDGAEKTALAQEIFGKSGADLIPLLNAGASALDEYDKTAAALGLTLSDETVKSAEAFNDTLDLVGQSTQGVARQVAAKLLPTLNILATELLGAVTNTDFMTGAANALSFAFRGLYSIGVGVIEVFKTVGTALGGVGAAIAAILSGDFGQVKSIVANMASDIGASWAEAGASIKRAWGDTQNTTVSAMAAIGAEGKKAAPVVGALTDGSKAHKKAIDEANKAMADEAKVLAELSGLSGSFYKDWQVLDTAYKKGTISLDGLLEKQATLLAKQPAMVAAAKEQIEAAKASNAAFDEQFKAVETLREATEGRIKSAREMLEAIERETSLMGLSNQEREQAIALFELERQGVVKGTEAYDAYAQKIKEAIAARSGKQATEELNKATTAEWKKTVDKYDDIFRGGFADMLNNGKGAWDSFTTSLTTTFKTSVADQIYKMFAQPFVVKFVASMLGVVGGTASGVASAASTGSSLLSTGVTLAGSSIAAIGSSVATGFAAGWAGTSTAAASAAYSAAGMSGVATGLGIGNSVGSVLASIGPAGWAAMAVLAVAAIASGRGETRSGAAYGTDASGKAVKLEGPSGGELSGDSVRGMFDATTAGINDMLKKLGSSDSVSAFVAGLESSKAGKGFVYAGGTLSTGAKFGEAGGRTGGEFAFGGQTAEEAVKGYQLQLKQATLQALSVATDIPKQVMAIVTSVDVTNVAESVLDDLMAQVTAIVGNVNAMSAALKLLPIDYLKDLSFATAAGLAEAAGGFDQFGASLGTFYDKFYSETEKTANATANLRNAFAAMNIVMPAIDDNTRAWYRSEVERLGAMDLGIEANAKAYTSALSLSGAVDALAPAFVDAAKAAKELSKTLADAFTSAQDDYIDALTAQRSAQMDAANAAKEAAQAIRSALASAGGSIKSLIADLTATQGGTADPMSLMRNRQAAYLADLSAARGGDVQASERISSSAREYLDANLAVKTTAAQQATTAQVLAELKALPAVKTYEEQLIEAVNGTTKAVVDMGAKAVLDLTVNAKSEIMKLITFVTNADQLPADLRLLALTASGTMTKTIDFVTGSLLADDLKTLALAKSTSLIKTVSFVLGSDLSVADKTLATSTTSSLTKTISMVARMGMTDAEARIALASVDALTKTINFATGTLDAGALAIAAAQSSTIEKILNVSGGVLTMEQQQLINGITDYSKNITLGVTVNSSELTKFQSTLMAIFGTIDITRLASSGVDVSSVVSQQALQRLQSVASYVRGFDWVNTDLPTRAAQLHAIRTTATSSGVSSEDVATAIGVSKAEFKGWYDYLSVPFFDQGSNSIPQDMLAMVHKDERVMPAADNRELMARLSSPQQNNDALVAEIRALRKEVADLRADNTRENMAIATHSANTAEATRRMDNQGVMVFTDPAAPIETKVVA